MDRARGMIATALLGLMLVTTVATGAIAGAGKGRGNTVDDVQLREYRQGKGVTVSVPHLGDKPAVYIFDIAPTPMHDRHRIGSYVVDIEWSSLPGVDPIVTVIQDGSVGDVK